MAGLQIVEVKLPPLIAEKQLIRPRIQLEKINLAIMRYRANYFLFAEVLNLKSLQIKQKSNDLRRLTLRLIRNLRGK